MLPINNFVAIIPVYMWTSHVFNSSHDKRVQRTWIKCQKGRELIVAMQQMETDDL